MTYTESDKRPHSKSAWYRPILTFTAAALAYFGMPGTPVRAQEPPQSRSLDYRISAQEAASPQQPAQEKKAEDAPKQVPVQDTDLGQKAYDAFVAGKKAEKNDDKINAFLESLKTYKLADKAAKASDPVSTKYADHIATLTDYVAVTRYNALSKDLDSVQSLELAMIIANYDAGKPYVTPQPKPEPAQPKQDPKVEPPKPDPKVDPPKQDPQNPPQQEPKQDTVPAEPKPSGPQDSSLLSVEGGIGPDLRHAAGYLRLSGIEGMALFDRNSFTAPNGDDIGRKTIGIYAAADFDRLVGLPLKLNAGYEFSEDTLGAFASDHQQNAQFIIDTFTTTRQDTKRNRESFGGELGLGDYRLLLQLYRLTEDIDVDVTTDLNLTNLVDPAGSFRDVIRSRQKFLNTTTGGQAGVGVALDPEVDGGLLFTLENIDMPDFDRTITDYRFHAFLKYLSENKRFGAYAIGGFGLLDDTGEKLTKGEYGAALGMELSDKVTLAGRFSKLEGGFGYATLLLGKSGHAVPHLLDNETRHVMSELSLDKRMGRVALNQYLRFNDADLMRWLADKQEWMLLATGGIGQFDDPFTQKNRTVYNWDVTLLGPLFKSVPVGVRAYKIEDDLSRRQGYEFMIFPAKKDWKASIVFEEEDLPGQGKKDKRLLGVFDIWSK